MTGSQLATMPRLRLASLDDYDAIAKVEHDNGLASMPRDDWRRLWLDNPLWPRVERDWPIGWLLENEQGQVVGSIVNIPTRYAFQGRELLCGNGRGWAVDEPYRSFAPALVVEHFQQSGVDLIVSTTVGINAAPMVSTLSTPVPLGDFQRVAYFATHHQALVSKALAQKRIPLAALVLWPVATLLAAKDRIGRLLIPGAPPGVIIDATDKFDDRFDAFWAEMQRSRPDRLLGWRDRATLQWHYRQSLAQDSLWVFTASRGGVLRAYCIVKRQDPGERIRRLRLVDFQTLEPERDLLSGLLRSALGRAAAEGFDVLEHVGCDLPKMRSFDRHAAYRRQLPSWSYYYQADPKLQQALAAPGVWDPSMYDGDASFD
jgi:hypothetical protein